MLEELKKRYQRYTIKKAIICIIISVVLLVISKFGIFTILQGPVKITGEWSPEKLEGKYVSMEVDWVIASFAEETSTNTKTNKTTTTSICYIGEYFYEPSEFGMFYGIKVASGNKSGIEKILKQVYNEGKVDNTKKITGTLEKMSGKLLQYYNEVIKESFDEGYEDYAVPYIIMDAEINGLNIILVYVLTGLALIPILIAVFGFVGMASGKYDKYIKAFLDSHPKVTMSGLESDYSQGEKIANHIISGRNFTFYQAGPCMKAVEHKELVWAYYFSSSGRNSQSLVRTFDIQKKQVDINASKKQADKLLQHYETIAPQMIVGYDRELEKCYKKEFDVFLTYRYNQAQEQSAAEEYKF